MRYFVWYGFGEIFLIVPGKNPGIIAYPFYLLTNLVHTCCAAAQIKADRYFYIAKIKQLGSPLHATTGCIQNLLFLDSADGMDSCVLVAVAQHAASLLDLPYWHNRYTGVLPDLDPAVCWLLAHRRQCSSQNHLTQYVLTRF